MNNKYHLEEGLIKNPINTYVEGGLSDWKPTYNDLYMDTMGPFERRPRCP